MPNLTFDRNATSSARPTPRWASHGDVKAFDNFVVPVPAGIDPAKLAELTKVLS
jgi:hypothetical protein